MQKCHRNIPAQTQSATPTYLRQSWMKLLIQKEISLIFFVPRSPSKLQYDWLSQHTWTREQSQAHKMNQGALGISGISSKQTVGWLANPVLNFQSKICTQLPSTNCCLQQSEVPCAIGCRGQCENRYRNGRHGAAPAVQSTIASNWAEREKSHSCHQKVVMVKNQRGFQELKPSDQRLQISYLIKHILLYAVREYL